MGSPRNFVRPAIAGIPAGRAYPALPRVSVTSLTRAGLPVVSNRAFISAWNTRRNTLAAAAKVGRHN